jgi:hypothetical protein
MNDSGFEFIERDACPELPKGSPGMVESDLGAITSLAE